MTSDPSRRFPIGLTVTVAVCMAILVGLGLWQVQRLHWKQDLLTRIAALRAAPAAPGLAMLAQGGDLDYVRVELDCPGLARAKFAEVYGIDPSGQAGSRLLSACPLPSGPYKTLLVDRGFVADTISARPPVDAADATPIHVVGVLRKADKRSALAPADDPAHGQFYTRDLPAIAAALGAPDAAPLFLGAETPTNPEWRALTPAALPSDIPNNHLQYVVTWFGLAVALAGVYAAMLFRRLKT